LHQPLQPPLSWRQATMSIMFKRLAHHMHKKWYHSFNYKQEDVTYHCLNGSLSTKHTCSWPFTRCTFRSLYINQGIMNVCLQRNISNL
jgi:hypothetical protein